MMNKDKIIKDLKERNDKLQSQYMQEQARNYHLNYVIENDLKPTLKSYEYEIITLKSDFEAQHELTKKYAEELEKIKQPTVFIDTQDMEERYGEQLYQDYLVEQNKDLQERISKAMEYIKEQELLYYSGTDDEEQYSKFSIDLLAILGGKE